MAKFLVQPNSSGDPWANVGIHWTLKEGVSAEEVAFEVLQNRDETYDSVKVIPYEPLIFGRGIKRLNPQLGMGCKVGK